MSLIRRHNDILQERLVLGFSRKIGDKFVLAFDHPENANSGDIVTNLFKAPARMIIDEVKYVNVTGLVEDATNYGVISVKQASEVCATWSTETTVGEGTIAADTYVDLTNGTVAERIIEADEEITILVSDVATTTIPKGRVEVHCRFIEDDVTFRIARFLKKARIDRIDLRLLAAIAEDNTDYYTIQIKQASVVVADWDTRAANEGVIAANTFVQMTLSSTDADKIIQAGEVLDIDFNENGDVVLSDIELIIHGRYL